MTKWLAAWAALPMIFATPPATAADGDAAPGLERREVWSTSRVVGSPDPPPPYFVEKTFTRIDWSLPLYIAAEPGGEALLVVEQGGEDGRPSKVLRVQDDPQSAESETLLEMTGRLIYSVAFHPSYRESGRLYVFSNGPTGQSERVNRVSRFTIRRELPYRCDPDSELTIIEWPSAGHDGGDMVIGTDGMLYIASGDGTSDSDTLVTGQDVGDLLGGVLRIDVDHPEPGRNYSVPRDNPFVALPGARPELWAYGLRNPWRMTIDAASGQIWVGNNGQDLWETAHLVRRGENYGWSVYEGSHPFYLNRPHGPTPPVPPTIEHHHSEFLSLTGGVVYRGEKHPELDGVYIYGDHTTGRIWGARHDGGRLTWHKELADTSLQITAFGVSHRGEVLIADYGGGIYRLVRAPAESPQARFPTRLSETGLFASVADHQLQPGVVPYSVNAPGWNDGASAERFLAVPGEAQIDYTSSGGWNSPDGTVLMQTLSLELGHAANSARRGSPDSARRGSLDSARRGSLDSARRGSPDPAETADRRSPSLHGSPEDTTSRRIETRLLVRQQGQWAGYSYRWNEQQTDATLVDAGGEDVELVSPNFVPPEHQTPTWRFPSRTECLVCHSRAANFALGLTEPQMNREHDYSDSGGVPANQLRTLMHIGLLAGGPEKQLDELPRLVDPYDASADLTARARSYLHTNCSVCHVEAGGGNSRMELRFTTPPDRTGLFDQRPQHDTFGIDNAMLIAPGDPGRSVLYHRVARRGRGQMPPVVTTVVDESGAQLIHDWIESLKPERPFVREWTVEDLLPHLKPLDAARSLEKGRAAFDAVGCNQCHRIGGKGGSVGPDLTGIGQRISRRALIESLVSPSQKVAPEYASTAIETHSGQLFIGRIEREDEHEVSLRVDPSAPPLVIAASEIAERNLSPTSNMPTGTLNTLELAEILDLLAYLVHTTGEEDTSQPLAESESP